MSEEDINKKWDTRAIVEETIRTMNVHAQPAPETLRMLKEFSANLSDVTKNLEDVTKNLAVLSEDFKDHKEVINTYIKDTKPVIEMGKNVQGFGKVSLYILGFFASVSGAVLLIINYFDKK